MAKLYFQQHIIRVQYNINIVLSPSGNLVMFISAQHLNNLGLVVTPATFQKPNKDAEILGKWIKIKHY